jgi:hypothetical protein
MRKQHPTGIDQTPSSKYYRDDNGNYKYPEQYHNAWRAAFQVFVINKWTDVNSHRTVTPPERLPEGWEANKPKSLRTGLGFHVKSLSDEIKEDILKFMLREPTEEEKKAAAVPTNGWHTEADSSREEFIDHDKLNAIRGADSGACLCELTIATGLECLQHLVKDEDGLEGKTINTAGNPHWGWYMGIAPRGVMCPVAKKATHTNSGRVTACMILLFYRLPLEQWVLLQDPKDPKDTIDRRVHEVWNDKKCGFCQGITKENNRLNVNQDSKCI